MAQKTVPGAPGQELEPPAAVRRFSILAEVPLRIEQLRVNAAFSKDAGDRKDALSRLNDLDSFAFVAEKSPHEDSREEARACLKQRLSSFTHDVLLHLRDNSNSPAVRSCATELLG